jgi:hypothetical protein
MAFLSRLFDGEAQRPGNAFSIESLHCNSRAFLGFLYGKPSFETSFSQSLSEGLAHDIVARILKGVCHTRPKYTTS